MEFTHYPFRNIEDTVDIGNLRVDSFLDIIVNKFCAMADRCEIKDYVDIYCSLKKSNLSLEKLIKLTEKKCGLKSISHVLKAKFLQVPTGLENLDLRVSVTKDEIKEFFERRIREIIIEEVVSTK